MKHAVARLAALGALALVPLSVAAALAQSTDPTPSTSSAPGNLPAVPNSERAGEGGMTSGHPSLPGPNGASPLEPYLVTWLLPASGILVGLAVVGADRATRSRS